MPGSPTGVARELIELLVRVPAVSGDALVEPAIAAGWPIPRELAMLVWPAGRVSRISSRLPAGCIATRLEEHWCAVVPDPNAPGRRAELERAFSGTAAGLGSATPPADAALSHQRARDALELARGRSLDRLVAADDERLALLLRSDMALTRELAGGDARAACRRDPGLTRAPQRDVAGVAAPPGQHDEGGRGAARPSADRPLPRRSSA